MALVTNIPITSATVDNMSRNEYLIWVNECLQAEFSKLEQLHTGAGYCLFTEVLFPNSINMKKVKFNSRLELEWLSNWKIVQTAWKQLGIEKMIPVEKLIKGKFQDNFEFLQWFKKFFDANYDGREYNPLEMRNFEELPKENKLKPGALSLKQPQQVRQQKNVSTPSRAAVAPPQRAGSNVSMNSTGAVSSYKKPASTAPPKKPSMPTTNSAGRVSQFSLTQQMPRPAQQKQASPSADSNKIIEELLKTKEQQLEELKGQLAETDEVVNGLEKERDFYFAKLRKIEVLCQDNETLGKLDISWVLQILYETEEGFAPPEEIGEIGIIESNGTGGNGTAHNNGDGAVDT